MYNWLYARQRKGTFILRIEDTDLARSEQRFEDQLIEDLLWLGLDWDEGIQRGGEFGPYRQTERFPLYRQYAERLLKEGQAYHCFCTATDLEREREEQLKQGLQPHYSGRCRRLSLDEVERRLAAGEEATVRLKVRSGKVKFKDLIFGSLEVDTSTIGDFILLRSDGSAQYNLACVVDDALMKITHVIRGEGHIPNTYRQVLLFESLKLPVPQFAHLSTIVGPDGAKLSKRHGATSIDELKRQGYLPEAIVNYLALLGWTPPEEGEEILTRQQLIDQFDLSRVHRSPATFDVEKFNWVNRNHLRQIDPERLASLMASYYQEMKLIPESASPEILDWLSRVGITFMKYVNRLDEFVAASQILFDFDETQDLKDPEIEGLTETEEAKKVISLFSRKLEKFEGELDETRYRELLLAIREESGVKGKVLYQSIRVATTGRLSGPELEQLIPLIEQGSRLPLPKPIVPVRERVRRVSESLLKSSRSAP